MRPTRGVRSTQAQKSPWRASVDAIFQFLIARVWCFLFVDVLIRVLVVIQILAAVLARIPVRIFIIIPARIPAGFLARILIRFQIRIPLKQNSEHQRESIYKRAVVETEAHKADFNAT